MDSFLPYELLFADMEKLSPGDDEHTREVLNLLPTGTLRTVVDAGAGRGRTSMVLAEELRVKIHAVDTCAPFLKDLDRLAERRGIGAMIETHRMDMADIPRAFPEIDLLWSEGAAYTIGFHRALENWRPAVRPHGFAVISEITWLNAHRPRMAKEFFAGAYPAMQGFEANLELAKETGWTVHGTWTLPRSSWITGYYDILGPRARSLLDHSDPRVRAIAADTVREIEVFEHSGDSYGYVFYILAPKHQ